MKKWTGCYCNLGLKDKEEVLEYIKIIYEYFESTNQLQYLRIAADEPSRDPESIQSYKDTLKLIKSVAPNIKFKIAFDKDDVIEDFKDDVDDIATSFPCTTRNFESFSDDKRKLWYVCNIPDKPNTFLRSPLLESRLLGSLNQVFNYDGLLRWAYTCWTENPREDIRYASQGFPVGDICLVYPEKDGSLAMSLRWKALKRGIEDNELISILKQQGKYAEVEEAYKIIKLNTNPNEYMKEAKITIDDFYSLNHLDFETYRLHLIQSIIENA